MRFWNINLQVCSKSKIVKPYTLIVFEKKKNKVPKQDSQNWLRSPMSEGGAKVTYV